MCMDLLGFAQGNDIGIWGCNGATNQLWRMVDVNSEGYGLLLSKTGYVVDIEGGSSSKGADAIGWTKHSGANQLWQ